MFEGSSRAELDEEVESGLVLFVAVVAHDVGVVDFGQLGHDVDLPLVLGNLLEHLLLHEFDGDDPVLTEVVAFKDDPVVALAQRLRPVDVEIVGHLLHPLHFF